MYIYASFGRKEQDVHTFAPLRPQYFSKLSSKFSLILLEILQHLHFWLNFEPKSSFFAYMLMKHFRNLAEYLRFFKLFRILHNICVLKALLFRNSAEMIGWYPGFNRPSLHGSTGAISTAQVVTLICLQQCGEIFKLGFGALYRRLT